MNKGEEKKTDFSNLSEPLAVLCTFSYTGVFDSRSILVRNPNLIYNR